MKLNGEHVPEPPGAGVVPGVPGPTEAEIRKVAYFLWQESGRPTGCELDHWLAAKERLSHHGDPVHQPSLHFPPSHDNRRLSGGN